MSIFFKRESGGLCRLQSLNSFFNHRKYDGRDFNQLNKEYDNYVNYRYAGKKISNLSFDEIPSNQLTFISFVLKKNGIFSTYVPINKIAKTIKDKTGSNNINELFRQTDFVFVYNANHIWGIRKVKGKWYKVDGNHKPIFNINTLIGSKNIGLVIPYKERSDVKIELRLICRLIKNFLEREGLKNEHLNNFNVFEKKIIDIITNLYRRKLLLSDLEVLLGNIIEIYIYFDININIIGLYEEFIRKFSENPNNINVIYSSIPLILYDIYKLKD